MFQGFYVGWNPAFIQDLFASAQDAVFHHATPYGAVTLPGFRQQKPSAGGTGGMTRGLGYKGEEDSTTGLEVIVHLGPEAPPGSCGGGG